MHWWYRPDSYDEFVAASVAPLDLDDDKPSTKGHGDISAAAPPRRIVAWTSQLLFSSAARLQVRGSCMRGGSWIRTSTTSG